MKNINWKVRWNNPLWLGQLCLAIVLPMIAALGLNLQDITSWATAGMVLRNALGNPYVLGLVIVSVFNAITDPTTAGVGDSAQAMTYEEPKK